MFVKNLPLSVKKETATVFRICRDKPRAGFASRREPHLTAAGREKGQRKPSLVPLDEILRYILHAGNFARRTSRCLPETSIGSNDYPLKINPLKKGAGELARSLSRAARRFRNICLSLGCKMTNTMNPNTVVELRTRRSIMPTTRSARLLQRTQRRAEPDPFRREPVGLPGRNGLSDRPGRTGKSSLLKTLYAELPVAGRVRQRRRFRPAPDPAPRTCPICAAAWASCFRTTAC